ncbi:MAG TPA: hypothetical protein VEH31_23695, partial [Streptosporangiaceae bacterium]|nr:hypothetical protein [Streptosporangiaceae bacterium]
LMSMLSPRFFARLGPRSITLGACVTTLGTIALALTGARYGATLTGWDLAPATVLIGTGQGIALPSLIGAALTHVPPQRSGSAAGILTTTQQFGAASGIAVIGAVFYRRPRPVPGQGHIRGRHGAGHVGERGPRGGRGRRDPAAAAPDRPPPGGPPGAPRTRLCGPGGRLIQPVPSAAR